MTAIGIIVGIIVGFIAGAYLVFKVVTGNFRLM